MAAGESPDPIVVVHSFPVWLPLTQTWMYNQVTYLPSSVDAHVACLSTQNLDQFGLSRIHSLSDQPLWRQLWEKGIRRLRRQHHSRWLERVVERTHAEIIHSHFGDIGWADAGTAKSAASRHVVTFYGYEVNYLPCHDPVWRGRYRELFASVDRVLCEGPHMARCVTAMGCPESKIRVHHLGVPLDRIPYRPRRWIPTEPLRILIAASFQEKKGIPDAIEATARLRADVPLEITVIGDANAEPRSQAEKRKILETIERCAMSASVRLLGYQPYARLMEECYRHHLFLHPSLTSADGDTEGGAPVTLIEMAASGMPVVSTAHCDIPEVILHGTTGLLAQERDVDGLVAQLRHLIETPDCWGDLVMAARLRLEQEYDAAKQGSRLAAIYSELV
ncbi:MAG: glycosyltransferase [Acidobacteria bacterium]|nr:glycosyltransferase [Acidobacteriota bacterium]